VRADGQHRRRHALDDHHKPVAQRGNDFIRRADLPELLFAIIDRRCRARKLLVIAIENRLDVDGFLCATCDEKKNRKSGGPDEANLHKISSSSCSISLRYVSARSSSLLRCRTRRRLFTRVTSSNLFTGLLTKSSVPHSVACSISPSSLSAVTI